MIVQEMLNRIAENGQKQAKKVGFTILRFAVTLCVLRNIGSRFFLLDNPALRCSQASVKHFVKQTLAALALIAVILLLSGCGMNPVNPPPVHAAAPYPGGCPNTAGAFGTSREIPGSNIALLDTPCPLLGVPQPIETDTQTLDSCGKDQVVAILTTRDIHVHSIRLWIGAGFGSKFETGSCLEVITAGVVTKTFRKEWDKHIEEHSPDAPFSVDFIIPAGSTVRLSRDPHSVILCNDGVNAQGVADGKTQGACATQEMAELWGE